MLNLFSTLTSKIFGATSLALLLALGALWIGKNIEVNGVQKKLDVANSTIAQNGVDLLILRGNNAGLTQGLNVCNTSVDQYKDVVDKLSKAGMAALAEIQKNAANVNAKIKSIDAMPAKTCADAAAILSAGAK